MSIAGCKYCGRTHPHHHKCPLYEGDQPVFFCTDCGKEIFAGCEALLYKDQVLCKECFRQLNVVELAEMAGIWEHEVFNKLSMDWRVLNDENSYQ